MSWRRMVQEGSFQEPRGCYSGGDCEPIQCRLPTSDLDDPDGHDAQVAGARQDPRDVDRRRAGIASAQEFQQSEGDRFRSPEQSGISAGKVLAVHAPGETRALPRTREDILGGE